MLYYKTYELGENNEWVVLIHGAGGSSSIWFKQIREYKKHFNVLMVDLRGHGRSKNTFKEMTDYTFETISKDVIEVLDYLNIKSAHFIGISLGTIIIRTIGELEPKRIRSMVLGGAVTRLTFRPKILVTVGNAFKKFIPYMWLYNLFAWIIMPKERHKKSRLLFVNEAKKLYQKEFIRWFQLTSEVNPLLSYYEEKEIPVPTLYLMGEEDYMFLPPVKKLINKHKFSTLNIIKDSGHVCNVDQPKLFNNLSISFIKSYQNIHNSNIV